MQKPAKTIITLMQSRYNDNDEDDDVNYIFDCSLEC